MTLLHGKTFTVCIDKLFNEYEFLYPLFRLQEAGARVVVAATEGGKKYKGEGGMKARSEKSFEELEPAALDGIVIAGGYGPDKMRRSFACLELVRELDRQKKLVAFICHAGWVPASAGILQGRRATSVDSIKDDMVNAGCLWEDSPVVRDENMISSRGPQDLPVFMKGILEFYGS